MKLLDIVQQLRVILPKHTDKFSTVINTINIDATNNIATITTDVPHKLKNNETVTLVGYSTKTFLESVSQDGLLFTFTTSTDHDLTEEWQNQISLNGFDSTDWNGVISLYKVPNRRTLVVRSTNSIPSLNTNEFFYEDRIDGINGQHIVTVINSSSFTITGDFLDGSYNGGTINSKVRIVGSISMERFLDHYTEQTIQDLYMCVVMDDADVSKDRNTYSDAIATPVTGSEIRLLLVDGFSVYIFGNTSKDIGAQQMIDICRHELMLPILKSVYGARFSTGLSNETDFRTVFTGSGLALYDKSKYVHVYKFEMSMEITEDDTVEREDTRAYRDTVQSLKVDEQYMTITVDQDSIPLT
jgi:hypothetical protein